MKAIPKEVRAVVALLQHKGFEAYLVGGCVRDIIMDRTPKDWDVTTNATPKEIQATFPHTFYENEFGTVGVVNDDTTDETLKVVEVTPYRKEGTYTDKRHPDSVEFGKDLSEDLKRRDFTINAIAYDPIAEQLIDPFKGHADIEQKLIRAVGNATERFDEDALRMLRAVRIATDLDFDLEKETAAAIQKMAKNIAQISGERIRDEITKILLSKHPRRGFIMLHELELLTHIIPELEAGVGIEQNQAHSFRVFEHILGTVEASATKNLSLEVRLAALFHDIAKPHTRAFDDKKQDWSFHGHEVEGSKLAKKRLQELRYPNTVVEKVVKLVRWHMFFSDTELITHSAVRRLIRNVGTENVEDLLMLRVCDRIGTGRPKERPYRLRKYQAMIEEVMRDPVSVGMLKINGTTLMGMGEKAGPRVGWILHALLEEVLEDPQLNTETWLMEKAEEFRKLPLSELKRLGEAGKDAREHAEEGEVKKVRSRYHVE
ncbi:MAG: CCA tRNA nucleotidyltransferase [Patescibacteria group bacterium]